MTGAATIMRCPGCSLEMTAEPYEGNYGRALEIDVCHHCNGLWFDGRESLLLSARATLELFKSMAQRQAAARATQVPRRDCPHCQGELRETHDLQRLTRYTYYECAEHGRYTTFFHFLREKNLLRSPTPKQLAQLKARVKTVQCSNCGAPISLDRSEACVHCQAPVSVLSLEPLEAAVQKLKEKATQSPADAALIAERLRQTKADVEREFPSAETAATDLVIFGLRAFFNF